MNYALRNLISGVGTALLIALPGILTTCLRK